MQELLMPPAARTNKFHRGTRTYDAAQMSYADDGAVFARHQQTMSRLTSPCPRRYRSIRKTATLPAVSGTSFSFLPSKAG